MGMIAVASATAHAAPKSAESYKAHVRAQFFADRDALVAGGSIELAVSLVMDKEWHVYWRNSGGLTGLPTEFKWTVPSGFKVGRLRFPAPTAKYSKILDETSFLLDGTAIFLATLNVPETAEVDTNAEIKVEVSWLACRQSCIPGDTTLTLSLPVVSKGKQPKPANKKVFDRARDSLPLATEKASYVKLQGTIDKKPDRSGDKFTATLNVEIKKGHHIQSNKPIQKGFIATTVFASIAPGGDAFDIGAVEYPKAKTRNDPILGKLSEFDGKVSFKIPIE
ncbi:MAG: protein-disulfide reductase DsbD family protein, partial [Planctomycetota bacterium]|nr:protein-disulfide reductase DsbD family protein [Planctomycetota bacterium]